jgi:hypothetical protein
MLVSTRDTIGHLTESAECANFLTFLSAIGIAIKLPTFHAYLIERFGDEIRKHGFSLIRINHRPSLNEDVWSTIGSDDHVVSLPDYCSTLIWQQCSSRTVLLAIFDRYSSEFDWRIELLDRI